MDNFRVEVVAEGIQTLRAAVQLVFRQGPPRSGLITHWVMDEEIGLVLLSSSHIGACALPFPMNQVAAANLCCDYMEYGAIYPSPPDVDGSTERGFYLRAGWSSKYPRMVLAVCPAWAIYHK